LGPIDATGGLVLLRDEPGDGLAPLRDDDFFSRANPAQETGVVVSQIPDGGGFHDASIL
jgi:hypothetical protein